MSRRAWFGGAAVAVGLLLMCMLVPSAPAVADQPLTVTHFSIEPTRGTVEGLIGLEPTFTNEPYVPAFTQAGAHPWGLTSTIEFATKSELFNDPGTWPTREAKDIVVGLPPGLIGNPMAVSRCSTTDALALGVCPTDSQVGVYHVRWLGGKELVAPIVDVVPEHGQSAEFAFLNEFKISAVLTGHLVRIPASQGKPASYGLTVSSNGIPTVQLSRIEATFWGVPADPSHDQMRGLICNRVSSAQPLTCNAGTGGATSGAPQIPFLTMGTDCAAGPQDATLRADSWEEPGQVGVNGHYEGYTEATATLPAVTGCNLLSFQPGIETEPDTLLADEPVGLGVNVHVPLNEAPAGLATSHLRDAVVTLPEGLSVNPGAVDGIRACEATGPEGINIEGELSEKTGSNGELQLAPGDCPDASIVGTAEAITPLLPTPVKGHVFLARPGCGGAGQQPCTAHDAADGNLYRLYLELGGTGELAQTGVHIKVEGRTEANPATGQLTTRFNENPQTPFSELKVHLNGGPRAPLANPATCGRAVTTADFTPWSTPGLTSEGSLVPGIGDAASASFFGVEGCSNPLPFSPEVVAGAVTPQAGQFTSFAFDMSRHDREQYVKGIQLHTPPGLLAMLSSVPLCEEAQANAGTCAQTAQIGTTRVASGAGTHPFEIEGAVYLTGPYRGSPFGLSVITHAVAGPFDLGLVVVRARIDVDRERATATITFDSDGPHAIPQLVFGVPLRLQRITASIDRPGFMFNPTNCAAQKLTTTVLGSAGTVASSLSKFAVGGCRSLGFKPQFKVYTSGHTSRVKGASLDTRLSYPAGSFGNDANIARVKVDLPKQLPSRLTTLQKACPAQTFEVNPAGCPPESVVGVVRATTPVLPVGLSGPAYFVSHGGQAFPSLIIVLQGDGVRVDLTGTTFIKGGVTSSTFKTVPDVPVRSFELYLPQGRYSALAAIGNLCKSRAKLKMPTEFVAQNGLVLRRTTAIAVTGCPGAAKGSAVSSRRARAKVGRTHYERGGERTGR
jgi:hypothetical protein